MMGRGRGNPESLVFWAGMLLFLALGAFFTWSGFQTDSINEKFLGVITMAFGGVSATMATFMSRGGRS